MCLSKDFCHRFSAIFVWEDTSNLVDFFVFILLGIYRASWICISLFVVSFGKSLASIYKYCLCNSFFSSFPITLIQSSIKMIKKKKDFRLCFSIKTGPFHFCPYTRAYPFSVSTESLLLHRPSTTVCLFDLLHPMRPLKSLLASWASCSLAASLLATYSTGIGKCLEKKSRKECSAHFIAFLFSHLGLSSPEDLGCSLISLKLKWGFFVCLYFISFYSDFWEEVDVIHVLLHLSWSLCSYPLEGLSSSLFLSGEE